MYRLLAEEKILWPKNRNIKQNIEYYSDSLVFIW